MANSKIIDALNKLPESLKSKSGAAFYTGQSAFEGTKLVYVLGLNPGGNPSLQIEETISSHINKFINSNIDWSEYQDGSWRGKIAGTHGMQPRVLHLFSKLGIDPRKTPSSNIFFVRSPRENNIEKSDMNNWMELCWDVHKVVIDELKIKVIICFGQTAGSFVSNKISANHIIGLWNENNNRRWKAEAKINQSGIMVISLPHPSIADWTSPNADPSKFVYELISANISNNLQQMLQLQNTKN